MTSVGIVAAGFAIIIIGGSAAVVIAEGYDKLARRYGWPR